MDTNKCLRARRITEIVLLVFALIILRAGATTPAVSTEGTSTTGPTSNITSSDHVATNSTANSNTEKARDYLSGDSYLDETYRNCLKAKDMYTCVKYRTLRYIHEMTSPLEETGRHSMMARSKFELGEYIKLIAMPKHSIPENAEPLLSESNPRSSDSEIMKLFRFSLRQFERFMRSYALTINVPSAMSSGRSADDVATPRFIDDDYFSEDFKGATGREKKKTLMMLLPLISFFHLKALLIPILLSVLFIKKLLVLGIIFLPSLLSLVKVCKPMHHHHSSWVSEPEPPIDYHSEYSQHPHYGKEHYGKEYASRRRGREVAQALAYRAYSNGNIRTAYP